MNSTDNRPTVVYIVGRGHCGSTLLELLLNRNPDIASMGEVNLLGLQLFRDEHTRWKGECSCGKRPFDCEVWRPTLNAVQKQYCIDLTLKPLAFKLSDDSLAEEYGWKRPWHKISHKAIRALRKRKYEKAKPTPLVLQRSVAKWNDRRDFLYSEYARQRDVRTVVDASKDYLQMLEIARYSKLNLKVLYLTRNPQGHAWSAIRKKSSNARKEALEWKQVNSSILNTLANINPRDWTQVRYEDLCANPNKELSRIFDFIGVPDQQLSPESEKNRRHTIAGNRTRFKVLDKIRHDESWKNNLTSEDLKTIEISAGLLSEQLGYRLTSQD